jgi:UDP-galactopyranose mutase
VDWLVVGAGLTGATLAERIASQLGQSVLVIDQRPHIGGNAFDSVDEGSGVLVHRYGAHLFHTSSESVWGYLSQFTAWRPYEHRVLGAVQGQLIPLPFNLTSLSMLLGPREAPPLERLLIDAFGYGTRVPVLRLIEHPHPALAQLGQRIYDAVFLNYTVKQWGRRPEELEAAVTGRVPIVIGHDDRYFRDPYQALPAEGYTTMVARMLDHPLITVATSTDFASLGTSLRARRTVFTGPIDEYFGAVFGPLPYRSLRFAHETVASPYQPVSVVNYPNEHRFTRIIDHGHFGPGPGASTVITREYPEPYVPGSNDPYYPMPTAEANARYDQYAALLAETSPSTVFAGRLAKYRYLDMDQAVAQALQAFKRRIRDGELAHA